jgi:hypothetical protein
VAKRKKPVDPDLEVWAKLGGGFTGARARVDGGREDHAHGQRMGRRATTAVDAAAHFPSGVAEGTYQNPANSRLLLHVNAAD